MKLITVRAVAHYDPPNDAGPLLCMIISLAFLFTSATSLLGIIFCKFQQLTDDSVLQIVL